MKTQWDIKMVDYMSKDMVEYKEFMLPKTQWALEMKNDRPTLTDNKQN